jgi:uncharacterized membrane protein
MIMQNVSQARSVSVRARAAAPTPAQPALSGGSTMAATVAILQRELAAVQAELARLEAAPAPASTKRMSLEQEQLQALRQALAAAPAQGCWLKDLEQATGLSKNVVWRRVRQLAYKRDCWLSLEPNAKTGKLSYLVRRPECVAVEQ